MALGDATLVGASGITSTHQLETLSFDSSGKLYSIDIRGRRSGRNAGNLYQINKATGAATSPVGLNVPTDSAYRANYRTSGDPLTSGNLGGAYFNASDDFFASTSTRPALVAVNTTTGAASRGNRAFDFGLASGTRLWGLAFHNSIRYGLAGSSYPWNNLYTLNEHAGRFTLLRAITGIPDGGFLNSITSGPDDDTLFATISDTAFGTISISTGVFKRIGTSTKFGVNVDPVAIAYEESTKKLFMIGSDNSLYTLNHSSLPAPNLAIGTQTVGGFAIGTEIVGGAAIGSELIFSTPAPDRPGEITFAQVGRDFVATLTDPDGIKTVHHAGFQRANGSIIGWPNRRVSANSWSFTLAGSTISSLRGSTAAFEYTDNNDIRTTVTRTI